MVISYQECLKNHAATVGGHAVDGCGEFMPSLTATPSNPTSLNCAACGCHRNFHRRQPEHPAAAARRRHHPYRPSSPPPLQFSSPHMLLALTAADDRRAGGLRKRKRTKFSGEQKEKMQFFCEKIGWRIRKGDENLVEKFCGEIGIGKRVLRIWMHNNKYMGAKADKNRGSQSSENGGNDSKQST